MNILKGCVVAVLYLFLASIAEGNADIFSTPIKITSGESITLSDYKGKKPVYLKFWASWCGPCMREMPHFQNAHETFGSSIQFISINLGINDSLDDLNRVVKKFDLTMPTTIDDDGRLAQTFKFVGTPYHLLFDKNMNLVHRGHKANETLDNKLALVSTDKDIEHLSNSVFLENEKELVVTGENDRPTGLFFTATWCDWYLKDTKPLVAENCVTSQIEFNKIVTKHPKVNWVLVVSSLWTGESDLTDYHKKFETPISGAIDKSNKTFVKFGVKDFPTLILINNGAEIYRTSQLPENKQLIEHIKQLSRI